MDNPVPLNFMMLCVYCEKVSFPDKWKVAEGTKQDGVCPICFAINKAEDGAISVMTNRVCEAADASELLDISIPREVLEEENLEQIIEPEQLDRLNEALYNNVKNATVYKDCLSCGLEIPEDRMNTGKDTCSVECQRKVYNTFI